MKIFLLLNLLCVTGVLGSISHNSCDRIAQHGYPCESHLVETDDGYKLTMFRIPYSHNLNNQNESDKNVVLLMHGLLCSSDSWVFNGPNDGLPYMLSDAGYDVWLGNSRGNDYSQQHVSLRPLLPSFWAYSWHEIGVSDIPAKIDFIFSITGQDKLHYVGHSQGTTAFFVMLSSRPEYNDAIKTSHMLAPPVFMENMNSPFAKALGPLLNNPTMLGTLMGTSKFTPGDTLMRLLMPAFCRAEEILSLCSNILFLIGGGPSPYFNQTLLPDFFKAHPSGCSTRQLLHYLQVRGSKQFRQYDRGPIFNVKSYGAFQPPAYDLDRVQPQTPIDIYYSDNDDMVAVADVEKLLDILANRALPHHVKYAEFNHMDYLIAENIKEVINGCVVDKINQYEGKPFNGHLCTAFTE